MSGGQEWRGAARRASRAPDRVFIPSPLARPPLPHIPPTPCAPVSMALASFSFQCLATFSSSGSSGLGADSSAWMLRTRNNRGGVAGGRMFAQAAAAHEAARRQERAARCLCHAQPTMDGGWVINGPGSPGCFRASKHPPPPPRLLPKPLASSCFKTDLSSTVRICSAGLHLSLRMSRQMRPSLSMFGW